MNTGKMIKVTDLLEAGIKLAKGDIVFCKRDGVDIVTNPLWLGSKAQETILNLQKSSTTIYFLKEFAKRENTTFEQPVPDWCEVDYNGDTVEDRDKVFTDLAEELWWGGQKWIGTVVGGSLILKVYVSTCTRREEHQRVFSKGLIQF